MLTWIDEGETLTVMFTGCDGKVTLSFKDMTLRVESDMPDSSGRVGVIYEDVLSNAVLIDGDGDKVATKLAALKA